VVPNSGNLYGVLQISKPSVTAFSILLNWSWHRQIHGFDDVIRRDQQVTINIEDRTASLYTALLDIALKVFDYPGQDKSRALRPHSGDGDTMGR
jgi:hypothetical protein